MSRWRSLDERERRLQALREEASPGADPAGPRGRTVDGEGVRPEGAPFPRASAATGYYGLPLLKEPQWTWEVPLYFFVGGAAGAAAVIGAASRLAGGGRSSAAGGGFGGELARDARWIATGGGALSGALLVADLGRPERFLHMLRVFKPQSPMSVGAWTLTAFSSAAAAATFADLVRHRYGSRLPVRVLGNAGDALAAATGLGMASYTGVLIGATVVPVWNRSVRVLPIHFAASGLASAVALLELAGHRHRALNRLGLAAAAVEVGTGAWHELQDVRALRPLKAGGSGAVVRSGGVLSGPVTLALRLLGARRAAAVAALAGSLLTRYGWMAAGRASARDPELPLQPGSGPLTNPS
ncbi:MAG TPA: NrfD/PsrC family molybdoenzyme membrane anchor subunit [Thermoanaerobaculia bacterium]|nr:NrfD/PsrC family molybdoenzyme membrane anchor subunit [Thermoanaerobaculia bacterium]